MNVIEESAEKSAEKSAKESATDKLIKKLQKQEQEQEQICIDKIIRSMNVCPKKHRQPNETDKSPAFFIPMCPDCKTLDVRAYSPKGTSCLVSHARYSCGGSYVVCILCSIKHDKQIEFWSSRSFMSNPSKNGVPISKEDYDDIVASFTFEDN
jgi:hypothetical protein